MVSIAGCTSYGVVHFLLIMFLLVERVAVVLLVQRVGVGFEYLCFADRTGGKGTWRQRL